MKFATKYLSQTVQKDAACLKALETRKKNKNKSYLIILFFFTLKLMVFSKEAMMQIASVPWPIYCEW